MEVERGGRDRDARRTTGEKAGEAVGGVSGMTAGAALGSLGGPLGTMIGAVAGAVGGWWAVHAATAAHTRLTPEQEAAFRSRHARRAADVPYERASAAYQFGFIAGCNPRYADEGFAAAERELRHGWTSGVEAELGTWEHNRDLIHEGFAAALEKPDGGAHGESVPAPGIAPLQSDPATEVANRVHDRVAHRRDVHEEGR